MATGPRSRLVSVEDVKEFRSVRLKKRRDITAKILEGVRQLHEPKQIEPFLREIISDPTETSHTSTEIADILTTHIAYSGRSHLAAFVIKGRSFPKVTSRDVGHQILRLRQIQNVGMIALIAVGHIQDDAKRDLFQVATDSDADYMIVDAVDLARLLLAHHKICPTDGTPFSGGKCPRCGMPADPVARFSKQLQETGLFPLSVTFHFLDPFHVRPGAVAVYVMSDDLTPQNGPRLTSILKTYLWCNLGRIAPDAVTFDPAGPMGESGVAVDIDDDTHVPVPWWYVSGLEEIGALFIWSQYEEEPNRICFIFAPFIQATAVHYDLLNAKLMRIASHLSGMYLKL